MLSDSTQIIPLVPLRGMMVFPHMIAHFDVGRQKSLASLEEAMVKDQLLFLVTQRDARIEEPDVIDLYPVGTVSKIKQLLKLPGDTVRVLVEGLYRGRILNVDMEESPFVSAILNPQRNEDNEAEDLECEALMRTLLEVFEEYVKIGNRVSPETLLSVHNVHNPGQFADMIAASILVNIEDKQRILETFDPKTRLQRLYEMLTREMDILELEKKINSRVKQQIDDIQREHYLREQMKAIQQELGEKEGNNQEIEDYRDRIEEAGLTDEAREKVEKELERLARMPMGNPEGSIIRTYIDWILDLPWDNETEDCLDLTHAARILEEDHYGLKEVKERIIEYLAVRQLTRTMKGPILCFVGPPGVGKTSVARSIARAMNRNFVRMSLGGVRDEAEIRGHRRTYIGAIPGRIISSIKRAGSKNPVFLFDEIDKMSSDFRGDPASAMLEVLDPEQNNTFRDHYLDLAFDLSRVMFLTTANTLDTVPPALLDRMEVIRIAGYTENEKINICAKYLVPKQKKEHGIEDNSLVISKAVIRRIIQQYTREAGVRNLERQIANICRKAAKKIIEKPGEPVKLTVRNLKEYLGIPKFKYDKSLKTDQVGVATGLAWTKVGGETLSIEVTSLAGTGKLELTGQLGDVMKESAKAGLSYIRSRARQYGIPQTFYKDTDIHIHIPEGAIPKDGPSAGITMTTAAISSLSGIPVLKDVAMTGEITLRGRVLGIGGLKEKALAAHRAGIHTVLIPDENQKDLPEIPDNVRHKLTIIPVKTMDDVLKHALTRKPVPEKQPEKPVEGPRPASAMTENQMPINPPIQ
jgi:ATP-dependent Lon protease